MFSASTHSFFMVGFLWAMGVRAECLDLHSPWFLWSQFTVKCGVDTPDSLGTLSRVVPVVSAPSEMR